MNPLKTIWLVARRELRERALKKGYLIGTVATLAVVVAAIVLPVVLTGDGPDEIVLGSVGETPPELAAGLEASLPPDTELSVTELPDRDAAEAAIEDGEVDAVLVDTRQLLADGAPDAGLQVALEAVLHQAEVSASLQAAGLGEQQVVEALGGTTSLEVVNVGGDDTAGAFLIAFLATILLIIGVQMSGASLLSGAIEEKSSRVVEILVSAARPWQLLTGKVLAINALTFLQIALIVAVGLAANAAVDAYPLPTATGAVLGASAIMLIAGFLFYAALFTVAGTLASTVEDAQSAAGPLYLAMWGAYGAVFVAVLPNPSGLVAQLLSYFPPTAPFIVPARVALGEIATGPLLLSVVVTLLGALAMLKFAGRIYAASLLAGGKLTWTAAWRAEPVR